MSNCGDFATCFVAYMPNAFEIAFAVIAVASSIAAITPTPADDKWVGKIYRVIDMLALNVGHAKETTKSDGGRFVPE